MRYLFPVFAAPETAPFAKRSAECVYDPLAAVKAAVRHSGIAIMSATTDTFRERSAEESKY